MNFTALVTAIAPNLSYLGDNNFFGIDSLQFRVSDAESQDSGWVQILIRPAPIQLTFNVDVRRLCQTGQLTLPANRMVLQVFDGYFPGNYWMYDFDGDSVFSVTVAPDEIRYAFAVAEDISTPEKIRCLNLEVMRSSAVSTAKALMAAQF